jgi:hypothetical protein
LTGAICATTARASPRTDSLQARPQASILGEWGRRDKHLEVAQVLQIARVAQRASLEKVAGSILEWTEQNHPDALKRTTAEIDAFFAALAQAATGTITSSASASSTAAASAASEKVDI